MLALGTRSDMIATGVVGVLSERRTRSGKVPERGENPFQNEWCVGTRVPKRAFVWLVLAPWAIRSRIHSFLTE
jgi:hypothetical protein